MLLLCTDLHLDDQSANEYRWNVFAELARVCEVRTVSTIYCLGDMTDKADRFSAAMLNRLVSSWLSLPVPSVILEGNHDRPPTGPSFWEFLSHIDGMEYVSRPTVRDDLILLPFSPRPREEWRGLPMRDAKAIFVHATRSGTIAENGFTLTGQDLPPIPRKVKVYSGDVHTQQVVDNWTYVGASHPVKFGDHYPCRFLLLDEGSYEVVEEIKVQTIGKCVVNISTLDDLKNANVRAGDQVRVRASVPPGGMSWGEFESAVDGWACERGVEVSSIEGAYDLPAQSGTACEEVLPEELLRAFAAEEDVSGELLEVGLRLLSEVRR